MVTLWGMHMRKSFFTLFVVFVYIWSWSIFNVAKADDYNTAVLSHVIKENISGSIDNDAVLKAELDRAAYTFAITALSILEKQLPQILEGVQRDLEIMVEEKYKETITN